MWWKLARLGVLFPNYMFIKFTFGLFWKENILQISCHNLNCIAFYFSYFKIILCLLWSNCPIQCIIHKYGNPVVLSMGLSDWSMTFKVNFEVNFQGECSSSHWGVHNFQVSTSELQEPSCRFVLILHFYVFYYRFHTTSHYEVVCELQICRKLKPYCLT